jgi:WD40 repeat protein
MKFAGHGGAVYAVAFTLDGSILTGSADRTIRLWRPNGQAVRAFPSAQARR